MKKIITGHKGFIGTYLYNKIDAEGLDILAGRNILTCDLPDADVVFHLAAQPDVIFSMDDPVHDTITNVVGTVRLAKRYEDSKFIFISSGGAIQEKIESPYGLSKFCAEEYVKMLCKNYIILRLPNIYGTGSRSVVDKFINGDVCIYGDGSATRDYVHVSDIVDAIVMSENWKQGTYYLGSGINTSVLDLAKATGKKIIYKPRRRGEVDHSVVKNNTEWKPKIEVISFIKNTLNQIYGD